MADIAALQTAATGWIGKASLAVDSPLSGRLSSVKTTIESAVAEIDGDGDMEEAAQQLQTAKQTLRNLNNPTLWEGHESYFACIYQGGDGSTYESGYYANADVEDTLDAIDKLQSLALAFQDPEEEA